MTTTICCRECNLNLNLIDLTVKCVSCEEQFDCEMLIDLAKMAERTNNVKLVKTCKRLLVLIEQAEIAMFDEE